MWREHRVTIVWFEQLWQDLRYALRDYRRAPGFAALIVVTLALGIGGNATVAGTIDRLLLRAPLHVREPDRVVRLLLVAPSPPGGAHVSSRTNYPTFLDVERDVSALETVGASSSTRLSFGIGPNAVEAHVSLVSYSFFSVFGVSAAIGRLFMVVDGSESSGVPIAVLGHGFWQRQFGGDTSVIGRAVRIGHLTYTVVGVSPDGFQGMEQRTPDAWLPMAVAAEREARIPLSLEDRGSAWLTIVGRMRRGATRAIVEQQATEVWRRFNTSEASDETRRVETASIVRGRGPDRAQEVNIALWLGGVSAFVLLIACANVANLLLGRAYARRREVAVRLALGASRSRLARQLLAETTSLVALAGAAAVYLAVVGSRLIQRLLLADDSERILDGRLFVITAAIALVTCVLVNLVPLIQTTSPDLTRSLRDSSAGAGSRGPRVRATLLATQAALCVILLIGAGLFALSLRRVQALDLGVDLDRTLMARVDLGRSALPTPVVQAAYDEMAQRVRSLDGVTHAAFAERDPYMSGRAVAAHTPRRSAATLWHEGVLEVPMEAAVDSGFFRAVGAASLRGRDFTSGDRRGAPPVAIINEVLAQLLWPGSDALGQCMLLAWEGGPCVTVVGVLPGFWKNSIVDRDRLVVYVPMAQGDSYIRPGSMFIRVTGDTRVVAAQVRRAIQSVRSDLPAVSISRMRDVLDPQFRPWRLAATMFATFALVALIMAVVGLYGVVSFNATQRSHEIAIRIALGASRAQVLLAVAGDGLRAVVVGLVVGGVAALGMRHSIGPLLFQTSANDPRIIAGVGGVLLSVAVVASLIPTMRVLRRSTAAVLRVD